MELRVRRTSALRRSLLLLSLPGAVLLGGCLGEPKLEDRWTRIDVVSASVTPFQTVPPGAMQPITMQAAITYRSIITGFAVVDLRASTSVPASSVNVQPTAARLNMAQDIDRILLNSVSVGRATRAITGWDHLIQHIDFTFDGAIPAMIDSAGPGTGGLFLLCYLGSGDEVERADGSDTLIVTPFNSTQYQLLPIGMELALAAPGSH